MKLKYLGLVMSSVLALPALSFAEVRTTKLDCKGVDAKGNELKAVIEKQVRYGVGAGITVAFSLDATGAYDGVSGKLAGQASVSAQPENANPIRPEINVTDGNQNKAVIAPLQKLLKDTEIPGSLVSIQVNTGDKDLPLLYLKGVIAGFSRSQQQALNANVYVSNGTQSQFLANLTLNCTYLISE